MPARTASPRGSSSGLVAEMLATLRHFGANARESFAPRRARIRVGRGALARRGRPPRPARTPRKLRSSEKPPRSRSTRPPPAPSVAPTWQLGRPSPRVRWARCGKGGAPEHRLGDLDGLQRAQLGRPLWPMRSGSPCPGTPACSLRARASGPRGTGGGEGRKWLPVVTSRRRCAGPRPRRAAASRAGGGVPVRRSCSSSSRRSRVARRWARARSSTSRELWPGFSAASRRRSSSAWGLRRGSAFSTASSSRRISARRWPKSSSPRPPAGAEASKVRRASSAPRACASGSPEACSAPASSLDAGRRRREPAPGRPVALDHGQLLPGRLDLEVQGQRVAGGRGLGQDQPALEAGPACAQRRARRGEGDRVELALQLAQVELDPGSRHDAQLEKLPALRVELLGTHVAALLQGRHGVGGQQHLGRHGVHLQLAAVAGQAVGLEGDGAEVGLLGLALVALEAGLAGAVDALGAALLVEHHVAGLLALAQRDVGQVAVDQPRALPPAGGQHAELGVAGEARDARGHLGRVVVAHPQSALRHAREGLAGAVLDVAARALEGGRRGGLLPRRGCRTARGPGDRGGRPRPGRGSAGSAGWGRRAARRGTRGSWRPRWRA